MSQNFNSIQEQPTSFININQNTNTNKEINILNDIEFTNCQRCKVKRSVFSCIICESFKFLCTKCDNYVHSLPSKQSHQRMAIMEKTEQKEILNKQEEEKEKEIQENSNQNILMNNEINNKENMSNPNNPSINLNLNNNNMKNDNSLNFAYPKTNDMNYKFNLSPINKEFNGSYFNNNNNRNTHQNFKRDNLNINYNEENINQNQNLIPNQIPNHNNINNNNYNVENNNTSISMSMNNMNLNNLNKVNVNNNNNNNENSSINNNANNNSNNNNNNQNEKKINNNNINNNSIQNINNSSTIDHTYNNNNNFSVNFRIPNSQTFSREYVYELKTIFEKEKSELLYKINSLNMQMERLKINFTDQINYLSNQLEDVNKKSNWTLKQNQENFEKKMKQNYDDKELLYDDFKTKLQNLENINKELSGKLEESLKNICDLKTSSSSRISELENLLRIKGEENTKEKLNCETKINELRKFMEEDKIKLMESYDKNINLLIKEFDLTKEKLNNLLKDREDDLRNLMDKHNGEIDRLQSMNKEMIKEIDCHKSNIYNIRVRSEEDKDELEVLRDDNDSMKRELRFQISELKMLDGHNKSLLKENEDLKIQISKLDKLVYGKIRMPQNMNNMNMMK